MKRNTSEKKPMVIVRESPFQRIIRKTGRKPTQCKCRLCKEQCHQPCLGTPQDILRIIDAGFADKLAPTMWAAGLLMGVTDRVVPMIQASTVGDWCVFYHDGLCELHDKELKPTEGRLSHHSIRIDNFKPGKSLAWNVAKEWLDPDNGEVLEELINKYEESNGIQKCLPSEP